MKLHLVGVLGLAMTAAACTHVTKLQSADTRGVYHVQCNGQINDMQLCKIAAGQACPQGFVELGRIERLGPIAVTKTFYVDFDIQRSMDVHCK